MTASITIAAGAHSSQPELALGAGALGERLLLGLLLGPNGLGADGDLLAHQKSPFDWSASESLDRRSLTKPLSWIADGGETLL